MRETRIESRLEVVDRIRAADGVVELVLRRTTGERLPDWTPGSHIDLILPGGIARQYSLCGDPSVASEYRVAVLRSETSRGGSRYVHDRLRIGDLVGFGGPRNNFPLVPSTRYLFIAGGIGITPILPMARAAHDLGSEFSLLYLGRRRATMAHLETVSAYEHVHVHPSDEQGRIDLRDWIADFDPSLKIYVCGPERLLNAVDELTASWPRGWVRAERFAAKQNGAPARSTPYRIEASASGISVTVQPGESVANALRAAGVELLTSCNQGICGTCETDIIAGTPDHRDSILNDAERDSNVCMFPCVSQSRSDLLVLDI